MKITVDSSEKFQTYRSIGASGAWWAQIVGDWSHIDPESGMQVRDRISQLLYSKENGIGMQVFRYNIGAGSKHSGKGRYDQPARSTQCFETAANEYDWSRDAAAVYMMKQAVKDGADEVIFFVNSPLERLTKNGMAHADNGKLFRENISKENYGAFAKYTLDVTEHFIGEGVPVKYISPVNEPVWVWNGGQEGCHYKPRSVRKVFELFANEIKKRPALDGVKLSGAESGDLRWFNKSYTRQLLKSKNVREMLDAVDVHSYCLPIPIPIKLPFLNNRLAFVRRFRKWMDKKYPDVPVNMSEWCHMQGGRDKTMASALVTARTMFEDFTLLNASSWQHWIAASEVDYCDGLIYINLDDKTFETTKRLYVTGNFSKYIKQGSVRIATACDDKDLLCLAFDGGEKITLIVINPSKSKKEITLPAKGEVLFAVTDKDNDLTEKILCGNETEITAESVNTFVFSKEA